MSHLSNNQQMTLLKFIKVFRGTDGILQNIHGYFMRLV